ncbi:MAG: hypothetical protein RBR05_00910 [Candidatus Methanomethylophilaceae archaeon]|nr:hypothetical protein [Candidatus Methanomethylophilaceae archaeon]MDD3378658.1 hypothetical protein [Candidatus Methanomethylophilaceae archaeon]MDY0223949.1 hypothetical protein [Candidatus Methanomethylophilaceae archaeon]
MDKERAFKEVQNNIKTGRFDIVGPQISEIVSNYSKDPFTLLTCASLLKVTEDDNRMSDVIKLIMNCLPETEGSRFEIAVGLRGLGFQVYAESILCDLEKTDEILKELSKAYFDMNKYEKALEYQNYIEISTIDDEIFTIRILCAMKDYDKAAEKAKSILKEFPLDYEAQKCYCSVLLSSGQQKEAEKFVKGKLKENKTSADTNALVSYFLWITGRSTAAGGYAAKAIKIDDDHLGALEILAYCLIDKNKIPEAKIVAGAINEKASGHPAVIRILDMCKQHRS